MQVSSGAGAALLSFYLCPLRNLKVKNPEKYGWDPKWLLSHLIDIYLHLDSEALVTALANDQVGK